MLKKNNKMLNFKTFDLQSNFKPSGDQPQAIEKLVNGINLGKRNQVLLGVTGSGKTFTMAQIISKVNVPTIIMAPNKTLAAQLYGEMIEFFPNNAVEYFVSYYDYYHPEAYVVKADRFIEKDVSINNDIDRLRHSATRSLLERYDVIIISSVSCIYGIGDLETYSDMTITIEVNQTINLMELAKSLVSLRYERDDINFGRGKFSIFGDIFRIYPVHYGNKFWQIEFFGDTVETIVEIDSITNNTLSKLEKIIVYSKSHYATSRDKIVKVLPKIKDELRDRIKFFNNQNKHIESQRILERTSLDIEMLENTGFCSGIENYSRYLTGRENGQPPPTLFEYLPKNALLIMDESHVSVSQISGMYNGDYSRKSNLVKYGYRLPSCLDNRPLKIEEWDRIRPQTIFVSATPNSWELEKANNIVVEQLIRPTGLLDPKCFIRPIKNQINDIINECKKVIKNNEKVIITTLTKKMSEDLTEHMKEEGLKVNYLHSEIDTLERINIIRNLRMGLFDVLIGINLLREGLDIPECGLVAILDADKEGFLRSKTSLIQIIGRASRNINGKVILYADKLTKSLKYALKETERRRKNQKLYNKNNNIVPKSLGNYIPDISNSLLNFDKIIDKNIVNKDLNLSQFLLCDYIKLLEKNMKYAIKKLDFNEAILYRNEISNLQKYSFNNTLEAVPVTIDIVKKIFNI